MYFVFQDIILYHMVLCFCIVLYTVLHDNMYIICYGKISYTLLYHTILHSTLDYSILRYI